MLVDDTRSDTRTRPPPQRCRPTPSVCAPIGSHTCWPRYLASHKAPGRNLQPDRRVGRLWREGSMKRSCCKKCGGPLRDGATPKGHRLRWCPACHLKAKRLWRSANPGSSNAHRLVARAVAVGALTPQPCKVCGDPKVEAHHPGGRYDQPLIVDWLCKRHHRGLHASLRKATAP